MIKEDLSLKLDKDSVMGERFFLTLNPGISSVIKYAILPRGSAYKD
jgi:hypothetical protein